MVTSKWTYRKYYGLRSVSIMWHNPKMVSEKEYFQELEIMINERLNGDKGGFPMKRPRR